MKVLTRNTTASGRRGRQIVRANGKARVGYYLRDGVPSVVLSVDGSDGRAYNVLLDADDLRRIADTRQTFDAEFTR